MGEDDDHDTPENDWQARLKRVRKENQDLYVFVQDGEDSGAISKEASKACFAASVGVMRRGGIIEPQIWGNGVSDDVLCTVVAQANHEARLALLRVQPELKEALDREVPPSRGGRSP